MPYTWPVTLAEAKDALNITTVTSDAELQTVIDAATAVLQNHPAYRVLDAVTTTDYTEWADGGGDDIVLGHYPVTTVTSVAEYTPDAQPIVSESPDVVTTFTDYGYVLDAAAGILHRTNGGAPSMWNGRVKVVYTAGSATVPADIRQAALVLVDHLWETQRGGQGPALPTGLDLTDETSAPDVSAGYTLPNRVRELLEPYERTPQVA